MEQEIKTVKVVVSNRGRSPRGVNTMTGTVLVNPGVTSDELLVSDGELVSIKTNEMFVVEEKGAGETIIRGAEGPRLSKMGETVRDHDERIAKMGETVRDHDERIAKLEAMMVPNPDYRTSDTGPAKTEPGKTEPTQPAKTEPDKAPEQQPGGAPPVPQPAPKSKNR